MHSNPDHLPQTCYLCNRAALVKHGRNSYLVECGFCQVRYEIDLTAYATRATDLPQLLQFIRSQIAEGRDCPRIQLEHVTES